MQGILPQQAMGYDRASIVFSPDGRLLQAEYAKKAVSHGALTLGVVFRDGALLMADRRMMEKLIVPESVRKILQVSDRIISSFAGLTSDARVLIRKCRVFAQQHKLTYGEEIDTEGIVRFISDTEQAYTQYSGIRPFGISFLLAGIDKKGIQLFETDPMGSYSQYLARAIGMDSAEANRLLEKKYKENLSQDEAKKLAIEVFREILDKEFSIERLEASVVTGEGVKDIEVKK